MSSLGLREKGRSSARKRRRLEEHQETGGGRTRSRGGVEGTGDGGVAVGDGDRRTGGGGISSDAAVEDEDEQVKGREAAEDPREGDTAGELGGPAPPSFQGAGQDLRLGELLEARWGRISSFDLIPPCSASSLLPSDLDLSCLTTVSQQTFASRL